MNILFFPNYICSPHYETDLEIAKNYDKPENKLFFIYCSGQLKHCLNTDYTNYGACKQCILRFKKGIRLFNLNNINLLELKSNHKIYNDIEKLNFSTIDELESYTYEDIDIGSAVASSLVFKYNRDHLLSPIKYRKQVIDELYSSILVYLNAKEIISNYKIDFAVLFNGRFSTIRPIMRICEKNKINFITHERGSSIYKYLIRENVIIHDIDAATKEMDKMWNDPNITKEKKIEIADNWYLDRRKGKDQSWYSFIKNQKKGLLPTDFSKDNINITIFTSTIEEYEFVPGFENPIYENECYGIRQIIEDFKNENRFKFYIRVHPNLKHTDNSQTRFLKVLPLLYKNITLIPPEDSISTYDLMDNSDLIIVFGSTTGIEAVYKNKKVILIGRAFYENLDVVYKPKNHAEVVNLIKNIDNLKSLMNENVYKYGYWEAIKGIEYQIYKPVNFTFGYVNNKTIHPNLVILLPLKIISKILRYVIKLYNIIYNKVYLLKMRFSPLISIIIPTYNSARYIEETINSVLKQTYKNWELIIVDDGSTDNTEEIVKKIIENNKDKTIIYKKIENSGRPAVPRNIAIKMSQGEYIAFLDSDDLWHPKKLELQIEAFKNHPDLLIVGTNMVEFPYKRKLLPILFLFDQKVNFKMLLDANRFGNSSVMIKRMVVDEIGYIDEDPDLRAVEDYDYWLRILYYKDNSGYNLKETLMYYRLHSSNISNYGEDLNYKNFLKLKKIYAKYKNYLGDKYEEFIKYQEKKAIVADKREAFTSGRMKFIDFIKDKDIIPYFKLKSILKRIVVIFLNLLSKRKMTVY